MHVYVITNTVNDKIYVGQHSKDDLQKYLRHKIKDAFSGHCKSRHLVSAIHKYGSEAFTIQSLVRPIDKQQMDELEKFFIRTLDARTPAIGYNLTDGGEGTWGWCPSKRTRRRMGVASSRVNAGEGNGRAKLTPEQVKVIRDNRGAFTQKELAAHYGVCPQTIGHIVTGRNWVSMKSEDTARNGTQDDGNMNRRHACLPVRKEFIYA